MSVVLAAEWMEQRKTDAYNEWLCYRNLTAKARDRWAESKSQGRHVEVQLALLESWKALEPMTHEAMDRFEWAREAWEAFQTRQQERRRAT